MDKEQRDYIKAKLDEVARHRAETGYMDCDPESLTIRADEADRLGYPQIASALRNFRDNVVNPLMGEGWDLPRIEAAAYNWMKRQKGGE